MGEGESDSSLVELDVHVEDTPSEFEPGTDHIPSEPKKESFAKPRGAVYRHIMRQDEDRKFCFLVTTA
jgi:hypothetical protein